MKKILMIAVAICLFSLNVWAEPFITEIKDLPMDLSFKRVKGDGTRHMYVFCDLDCPHCQRAEMFFYALDNVTIHMFVMPVPSYHPDAPRKTDAIWCSDDKVKAWQNWFDKRELPEDAKDCKAPSSEITEYANAHNIYLPAIIFEDGTTYHAEDFIYATQTSDKLSGLLDEHSKE